MKHSGKEPLVAQREASGIAEQAGNRQIEAEQIPCDQQTEAGGGDDQVALQRRGPARSRRAKVAGAKGRICLNFSSRLR